MPAIRLTAPINAWIDTLTAGTVVVLSFRPDWDDIVMAVEHGRPSHAPGWPRGLRFLRTAEPGGVREWLERESVASVEFWGGTGAYALAPDTPEQIMAVRMRWR